MSESALLEKMRDLGLKTLDFVEANQGAIPPRLVASTLMLLAINEMIDAAAKEDMSIRDTVIWIMATASESIKNVATERGVEMEVASGEECATYDA